MVCTRGQKIQIQEWPLNVEDLVCLLLGFVWFFFIITEEMLKIKL